MYSHILIATDGSELAQKGVDQGLALAKQLGSKITVLNVSEPLSPYLFGSEMGGAVVSTVDFEAYRRQQKESATAILDKAKTEAANVSVPADTVYIEEMRPAEAIIDEARERNCSLIVMASHGRRGLGRLFLGSQTIEVLTHSPIPVLVVR
ncbi:MAG TPA: universal stress protein [Candidatus Saccharimonadales bacterium]|nr:universal stress protein [Candidatus Saccharimonadales bacterium]